MVPFGSFSYDIARQQAIQEMAEEFGVDKVRIRPRRVVAFVRWLYRRLAGLIRRETTTAHEDEAWTVPQRLIHQDTSRH